jgi:hypothetical protein
MKLHVHANILCYDQHDWSLVKAGTAYSSGATYRICGVMVSVLSSSVVDNGFESGRVKRIFCWFSAQYTVLGSKSKEWLSRNQCILALVRVRIGTSLQWYKLEVVRVDDGTSLQILVRVDSGTS